MSAMGTSRISRCAAHEAGMRSGTDMPVGPRKRAEPATSRRFEFLLDLESAVLCVLLQPIEQGCQLPLKPSYIWVRVFVVFVDETIC